MRVLDLFSGIGGFSLGLERAGMRTVAFCEIDSYCRAVLAKHWPDVPCHDDVRTFSLPRGFADVICGGFPCQDISFAGSGKGLDGERSGLWREFARIIRDIRPRYVIVENVGALAVRGLVRVLGDIAEVGMDAEWSTLSACAVGAPHMRRRLFIVAYADSIDGRPRIWDSFARQNGALQTDSGTPRARASRQARMANPSELYRGADGVAFGMERNHAIGNSVDPDVVEQIGRAIMQAEGIA